MTAKNMFFGDSRKAFARFPVSFSGASGYFLQGKPPTNTQHQYAIESPVWFATRGFRVVADEGDNLGSGLRANPGSIVLPLFHRLISYPENMSHLDIGQFEVNADTSEMLPKRSWMFGCLSPNPPIR